MKLPFIDLMPILNGVAVTSKEPEAYRARVTDYEPGRYMRLRYWAQKT